MEETEKNDDVTFNAEEAYQIVKEVVERHLMKATYDHSKTAQWIHDICEESIRRLTQLNKPFKYIVTCLIVQRTGAGVHSASSCFWDSSTDDFTIVSMENENKSLCCVTSVYGVAL
eukprot:TRINITY_DN3993_c0_g1_i1.p1 TRINITY_DN3993_c0_g1~~TRINITY_DN3993_c0_g1_i1.p1  ORF type:complete len:116 (+),score=37.24 TRINITY_DN3993_c0_g1_i1:98-445(+)